MKQIAPGLLLVIIFGTPLILIKNESTKSGEYLTAKNSVKSSAKKSFSEKTIPKYKSEPEPNELSKKSEKNILPETERKTKKTIVMRVTAYCPCKECCGSYTDGKTSTGKNAYKTLGVAADPKLLPYGTKLIIPGVGEREVDDTGAAMRQSAKKGIYHIDVRFPTHQEAKKFGVRWLEVTVITCPGE